METYQSWNHALSQYFLQGVAKGSRIYLRVDDEVLTRIGDQDFETSPLKGSWREDFIAAVRRQVIKDDRVDLETIQGRDRDSAIPWCVGFLGICVLAAYDMASSEEISDTNYFRRLRAVLNLGGIDDPRLKGSLARPQGMKPGSTEPLWKLWNQWLRDQDMMPSACTGSSRNNKFIHYPISQCLLRQGDRDRLEKYFCQQKWEQSIDEQTLFSRLREHTQQFPAHLRKLIKDSGERYEVIMGAIHELHQEWLEAGCPEPTSHKRKRQLSPNLFAGLYRLEEDDEIEYYLYPKQKPQQQLEDVQVEYQGQIEVLERDRPGWYVPIGNPLHSADLNNGIRCDIREPEQLQMLRLPARDFWILVPDPDEPNSGVHATWHNPQLGQPFILLCKKTLLKDLMLLRDERLVNWSEEIQPFEEQSIEWQELHNFMVISQAWQNVFIENWELKDLLRPKVNLSLSLSGGLRAPNQKGWLQGYPPQVTAFGFMPSVNLEILQLPQESILIKLDNIPTNQPQILKLPETGSYLIRAISDSKVAECFLRVIEWNVLEFNENLIREQTKLSNDKHLCGAVLSLRV